MLNDDQINNLFAHLDEMGENQGHRTSSRAGGLNCEPLKAVCVEQIMRPLKGDDYSPSCS